MLRFEHIVCNVSRHLEADLHVFTGVSSRRNSVNSKVATAAVGVTGKFVEEAVKIVSSGSGVARRSVEGPACSPFNFVRHTHDPSMRSSPNTFWIISFLSLQPACNFLLMFEVWQWITTNFVPPSSNFSGSTHGYAEKALTLFGWVPNTDWETTEK